MQVKDLQPRQGNVDITLEVTEKSEPREFQNATGGGKVCNAKAKDESGSITLSLWNDDIEKVTVGSIVKITNGWVSEWQGELQLSTGKFGQLEVTGKSDAPAQDAHKVEGSIDADVDIEEV